MLLNYAWQIQAYLEVVAIPTRIDNYASWRKVIHHDCCAHMIIIAMIVLRYDNACMTVTITMIVMDDDACMHASTGFFSVQQRASIGIIALCSHAHVVAWFGCTLFVVVRCY